MNAMLGLNELQDQIEARYPEERTARIKRERERKAWQRQRNKLLKEMENDQVPLIVTASGPSGQDRDDAAFILRLSMDLCNKDAPEQVIRDLLRIGVRFLGAKP